MPSTILFRVACELFEPNYSDRYASLYPFLEKWARASRTKMLTVVFDDYERQHTYDLPSEVLVDLKVSVRLVSLKHLMTLKYKNMRHDYQAVESGSCVLLLFSNTDHLRDVLVSPHLASFWHPENFYILQEQGQRSYDQLDHERFCKWAFERLWRLRRVFKLLLLVEHKVIRYDPIDYAGRHAHQYTNDTCDWYCIKSSGDNFLSINEPNNTDVSDFFDEDRRDFNSYPLRISIFKTTTMPFQDGKFAGLDFKYLEEVCDRMNVTPVLVNSKGRYGWVENGVYFGTIGHLVYKFADVSFNQFFVKDYLTRQMEFTTPITSDKLCVLVPKAPPVPDYLVIIKIFTGEVWLLIIAIQLAISMIYTILQGHRNREILTGDRKSGRAVLSCEYSTELYFVKNENCARLVNVSKHDEKKRSDQLQRVQSGKTMERHAKLFNRDLLPNLLPLGKYLMKVVMQLMQPFKSDQPWFPERLLLMSSLFLSLILNGVVTSQLASTLSKRLFYQDIDTLEELEKSGLAILTNSRDTLADTFIHVASPLIKRLQMKLKYANDSEINRRLFEAKDAAFLHRVAPITLKYDKNQIEKLHIIKECPREYVLAVVTTKGSPFRGRINSILGRLNNGGFYGKWYQSLLQSQKRAAREIHGSTVHQKITIRHLFIPFGILYVGLATSTIVLIFERRRKNVR
ncbi:unnamed protein product [Xylocopa violacea]|uniref:Uncharacterized protein n=1 Tax=Xylocopa violacea TaxID=135666 RepID=A0ABP1P9I3_XYLVO